MADPARNFPIRGRLVVPPPLSEGFIAFTSVIEECTTVLRILLGSSIEDLP